MPYQDILYAVDDRVATITINRPEVRNAYRLETLEELRAAVLAADADSDVGVVVLTGSGDKSFCAGGDLSMDQVSGKHGVRAVAQRCSALSLAMRTIGKPIIAKVRGWCIGGGNELNLICDLTIAADDAKFGQVGPKIGHVPVWWATQLLPRVVGDKRAKEIVMLCQPFTAAEAQRMGWINLAVAADDLDTTVRAWCDRLLTMSPQALRVAKIQLNAEADRQAPAVVSGFEMISLLADTDEYQEGMSAFTGKRPADFDRFR